VVLAGIRKEVKMKHFIVRFEIEGSRMAEGVKLSEKNVEETISLVFDKKGGSPLFGERLDTKVSNIRVEEGEVDC